LKSIQTTTKQWILKSMKLIHKIARMQGYKFSDRVVKENTDGDKLFGTSSAAIWPYFELFCFTEFIYPSRACVFSLNLMIMVALS